MEVSVGRRPTGFSRLFMGVTLLTELSSEGLPGPPNLLLITEVLLSPWPLAGRRDWDPSRPRCPPLGTGGSIDYAFLWDAAVEPGFSP